MAGSSAPIRMARMDEAPAEALGVLSEIQDTLGIPWPPDEWRAYAAFPRVMRLFWERLKPVAATEPFLEDSLEIADRVYKETPRWYVPAWQTDLPDGQRRDAARELDAFAFGNPQLLILQRALHHALKSQAVGDLGGEFPRAFPSPYRTPDLRLVDEQDPPPEVMGPFEEIRNGLDLPVVPAEFRALAKWPTFLRGAWEDTRDARNRGDFRTLRGEVEGMAEQAARRIRPAVTLDEHEIRGALDDPAHYEKLWDVVDTFTRLLPALIVQDGMMRLCASGGHNMALPVARPLAA